MLGLVRCTVFTDMSTPSAQFVRHETGASFLRARSICGLVITSLLLLVGLPAPALAGQAGAARGWLDKMAAAVEQRNYIATFVYRNGNALQSMQVIHRYDQDGEKERMVSLTGAPREVVRDGRIVTCILPDDRTVLVVQSRSRREDRISLFNPAATFEKYYSLTTKPGTRVAGRPTQIVEVEPRDVYRYGYRLALDIETGLPLKSELVGERGQALEQIVYTNIELPAEIPDELLQLATKADGFTWYRDTNIAPANASPPEAQQQWRVNWLPLGFEPSAGSKEHRAVNPGAVQHLVYSDGLATLSVFIENLPAGSESLEGIARMGAVSAFGRVVDGVQITVVGEIPTRTALHVGQSVLRK